MKIKFDIDQMRSVQARLVEIKTQLKNKYDNDVRIINDITQNIRSNEITPALQEYISANEAKSTQIVALFEAVDTFLSKQIAAYSGANEIATDSLSQLQSMLEDL